MSIHAHRPFVILRRPPASAAPDSALPSSFSVHLPRATTLFNQVSRHARRHLAISEQVFPARAVQGQPPPRALSRLWAIRSRIRRGKRLKAPEPATCLQSGVQLEDGFSVRGPTTRSSRPPYEAETPSCCALLKRWISSTNNKVPCPVFARDFSQHQRLA